MRKINAEIYFDEPLTKLSHPERVLSRIIISVWEIVFVFATIVFILSTVSVLRYAGAFMFLFALNGAFNFFHGKRELSDVSGAKKINAADFITPRSKNIIMSAYSRTWAFGGDPLLYVCSELLRERSVKEALLRMDVDGREMESKIGEKAEKVASVKIPKGKIVEIISKLVIAAVPLAFYAGRRFIEPADLFAALREVDDDKVAAVFDVFDIKSGDLERALIFGRMSGSLRLPSSLGGFSGTPFGTRHRYMNRSWTARPTPFLDKYSTDLTDLARAGRIGFMINHEEEYDRLLDTLSRSDKPNALIVGDPGVGKETLVAHLAYMISKDEVPAPLFDKRLAALDIGEVIAGADQAEIEERIKKIFSEINAAGNIILFINDFHNLVRTGEGKSLNAADALLPYIVSNDFPAVAATYPREYKQFI